MPATEFICNTGEKTPITKCLNSCPNGVCLQNWCWQYYGW